MGYFKDMLKSDESLIKDDTPLSFEYIPKLVPFREKEQRQIALCIRPLFQEQTGRNLFLYGPPGVGKTVATTHLLKELEDETDDVKPIYINCWQKNTTYKIYLEICNQLNYTLTHNKKTEELFKVIEEILNQQSVVFVFDEIDKVEETDFLYTLMEKIFHKTIILITNYKEWLVSLDERIKSRLIPDKLEFAMYNDKEIRGILKERIQYAFSKDVLEEDAFELVVKTTIQLKDVRIGLYILKESAFVAENEASRTITTKHVQVAIEKLDDFSSKEKGKLDEELRFILEIVKHNSGQKIGDVFVAYEKEGGVASYKTFQRKLNHLSENRFVTLQKTSGGAQGNTTIVSYSASRR